MKDLSEKNDTLIIPVEYGKSVLSEDQIFSGGDKDKVRPIVLMIYLIKTGDRNILVDAGCVTMPGFVVENFICPFAALKEKGVSVGDITDLIITHSHHDHIECASGFKNARIYIQKYEWEEGKRYIPDCARVVTFEDELSIRENVKIVRIGGHSKDSCIVEIACGEQTIVIAGDECYSRRCLDKRIPTGNSFDPEKSRRFIEKYSNPKYRVLLCHDR